MLGRQSFFETDLGNKSEIRAGQRRVGVRMSHVALLRRIHRNTESTARNPSDHVKHVIDRDAGAASNIVHATWNAAGRRGDIGRDRVVHKREVACLLAIPVHRYRLIEKRRAQKLVEPHVRTLARSIDSEVPQRHGWHALIHVIQVAKLLGGQLTVQSSPGAGTRLDIRVPLGGPA